MGGFLGYSNIPYANASSNLEPTLALQQYGLLLLKFLSRNLGKHKALQLHTVAQILSQLNPLTNPLLAQQRPDN